MTKVRRVITGGTQLRPLNILTFPTHERYESQLAKTGHNFYSFHVPNGKKWNKDQVDVPENYYILPEGQLPSYIDFDLILVQSKFWQYQYMQRLNQMLQLPVIVLEHTMPTPQTLNEQQIATMRQMLGHVNVFISKYSQEAWGISQNAVVIHHGIDTDKFENTGVTRQKHGLTVANEFQNRDYCLNYSGWQRVVSNGNIPMKVVGNNPGLSESAKSIDDLVQAYNEATVYFNSSTLSPIPTSMLEAMACECPVVSTATCLIPEIVTNGQEGFISNDESVLTSSLQRLLADPELAAKMGKAARQCVLNNFGQARFIAEWTNIFYQVCEVFK